jgi:hypothetical protein
MECIKALYKLSFKSTGQSTEMETCSQAILHRPSLLSSNSENKSFCLFICFKPHEQFFSYLAAVTITGDRAANLDLCLALRAFEQGGVFIVPHPLRHGASVYTVSSERPAPTSHSGIRTPDARTIRALTTAPRGQPENKWILRFLQYAHLLVSSNK